MAPNIQNNILIDLLQQVREAPHCHSPGRRTDEGARKLGISNSVYAHHGLELRRAKLVTSTNDGSEFNLWQLSTTGYAKAVELANVKAPKKEFNWLVWSPESDKPPQVKHSCEQEAMAVAESMAARYPGRTFYAVEMHAGFQLKTIKKEVVKIETTTKMEQF